MNISGTSSEEMHLVAFKVGREEFAVDVHKVERVINMVEITRMPRAPDFVKGIMNLRGRIIAVIDLATRLGIKEDVKERGTRIVVVESRDTEVGIIASDPEVITVSYDSLQPKPEIASEEIEETFMTGVVRLDERLLILLDIDRVLEVEKKRWS